MFMFGSATASCMLHPWRQCAAIRVPDRLGNGSDRGRFDLRGGFVQHCRMLRLAVTAVLIWLALPGAVVAQDTAQPSASHPPSSAVPVVTWGIELDVVSKYLWRGFPYSEGKVVWPSAWASGRGFTASLFTHLAPNYEPPLNEYDIAVGYERTVGLLTLTATHVRYAYFEGDLALSTTELIGRAAYAVG